MPTPTADPPAHRLLVTTFPDEEVAAHIARTLVGERLAACVNLVPGVRSIYRWQEAVEDGAEIVGLIKTSAAEAPRLIARLTELHPYEVPEAIALDITDGHPPYLAWLAASVGRRHE